MKTFKYKQQSGFTIVELLIVIVVIGILAAITIVAYNGVTQRASNTSIISAASQSVKLLTAYKATNGDYPIGSGQTCLTVSMTCTGGSTTAIGVDNAMITSIQTNGTLPKSVPIASPNWSGIIYQYGSTRTYNGVSAPAVIYYSLLGVNQYCGLPNISNSGGATMLTSTGNTVSNDGGNTVCFISLQ